MTGYECSISVTDIHATAKAIVANGGTLTMQAMTIDGVGTLVMVEDTEGNTVTAIQYLPGVK